MCPTHHLASSAPAAMLADGTHAVDARAHFLVVDDVSSMRRVISALLKEQLRHIRVSEAADGEEALRSIRSAEKEGAPIEFVVTDWNMPRMDGISLLRALRGSASTHGLPVLLVTADATRERILEAAHAGADGYIVKPFNALTLKTKLEQVLARRKGRQREIPA